MMCEDYPTFSVTEPESYDDVIVYESSMPATDYDASISRAGLFAELLSLPRKYAEANWDGYGAAPLSKHSFSAAVQYLGKLPLNFPLPRILVDPDGDICAKWVKTQNNRLELTFSKGNTYYAVAICNGIRTFLCSTSRNEISMKAERVLGWRE